MNAQTPSTTDIEPLSSNGRVMVLLVDDQAMVAEAIRRLLLNEENIDFHFCSNALEATKVANQIRPTVILQDLVMPDVNGLTQVRRFRTNEDTKETPIIVLSTKEDPIFKRDAFAAGANDYLVKLPDKLELVARIRYHSKAYLNVLQRDAAYHALRESQQELLQTNTELTALNQKLEAALAHVKQLEVLLPICCYCKKIRDDHNSWNQLDHYICAHSEVQFSHGVCPDCYEKHTKPELDQLRQNVASGIL